MESLCSYCVDAPKHSHDDKFKNLKKSLKFLGADLDRALA